LRARSLWREGGKLSGLAGILICLAGIAGPHPAAAAEMPPGASSCSGCHPADRAVRTPVAILVGRPVSELVAAVEAFRSGTRPATVMNRIAKGFSDAEIAAIAAWYAAQPGAAKSPSGTPSR
jgi:cytochrome subunit of sulfide dehydrogenase